MKIGVVTTWFERGASYVSKQYLEALHDDHEVFIYARGFRNTPENEAWDQDFVHWGKESILPVPMAIDQKDFIKWIRSNALDIVFFNEQQWWPPVLWAREEGVITGAYIDYYTEETIPLFEAYDFLICNTKRHFEAFEWHAQAHYIPWGTDIDLFKPGSFDPVGEVPVFFQSCGYSPLRKGTDFIIEAFSRIDQASKLIIHSQVDLKKAMPEQADNIDMLLKDEKLEIIEKTVSAPGLYHLGDVYVAPSRLEGIGLTAAEAISCGLPFITTDFPPMNEFVTEDSGRAARVDRLWARKDGYYWPQCRPDIESLADQMRWYIDNRRNISDLKRRAREYAGLHLDWEKREPEINRVFFDSKKMNSSHSRLNRQINEFERGKSGIKLKIARKFPFLYKILTRYRI